MVVVVLAPRFAVGRQMMMPTVNTLMSRPCAAASAFTAAARCAVSATETREACMKKASQLRTAKARPVGEAPAFMITGLRPPNGFGLARTAFKLDVLAVVVELLARPTTSA